MPYETYLPKSVPAWLQGKWGRRFFVAVGRRMDAIVTALGDASGAKFPALAPEDALPYIAAERGLPRGPAETLANHRLRLADAWEIWGGDNTPLVGKGGGGGSPLGMLKELALAGVPVGPTGAHIVQQNGRWHRLDNAGEHEFGDLMDCVNRTDLTAALNPRPGWTFDHRDNFYSAFGIIFPQTQTVDAAALNTVVEKWRPDKMLYIGAWVITTGDRTFGWPATGRTLGTEPALGGNTVTFIPGARGDHVRIGYYP